MVTNIDQPIAFLKEGSAIFSDDRWNAIINFDLTQFSSLLSRLEKDLEITRESTAQSNSIGELKQVEEALQSARDKLDRIHRFLPRHSRKRGLFNLGGTILKSFFGL